MNKICCSAYQVIIVLSACSAECHIFETRQNITTMYICTCRLKDLIPIAAAPSDLLTVYDIKLICTFLFTRYLNFSWFVTNLTSEENK